MSSVVGFVESTPDLMVTVSAVCPQPGLGVTSEVAQLLALRHRLPISTWKKKISWLFCLQLGSGLGGEWSGVSVSGGWHVPSRTESSVPSLSSPAQTLLKSVWILVETSFLIFSPLVSLATPKQTHTAMSPGSQLPFPADTSGWKTQQAVGASTTLTLNFFSMGF